MRDERTTRLCTKCGAEKSTEQFPVKTGSQTQGHRKYRSHVCRTCTNAQNAAWFALHPDVRKKAARNYWNPSDSRYAARRARHVAQANARRSLNYAFMDSERVRGCVDCGEKDLRVLQFDHVRGKTANLSVMSLSSTRTFLAELDRCEVVCANCHARRTYRRRLTKRASMAALSS